MTTDDIEREARALKALCNHGRHANIISVFKHGWLTSPSPAYYFDMELCELSLEGYIHGNRSKYIHVPVESSEDVFVSENSPLSMTIRNVWAIMAQIAQGIEFMHLCKHVHGDLKPSNSRVSIT